MFIPMAMTFGFAVLGVVILALPIFNDGSLISSTTKNRKKNMGR